MQFKIREISLVKDKTSLVPRFAFGNKASDVQAFGRVGIPPRGRQRPRRLQKAPAGGGRGAASLPSLNASLLSVSPVSGPGP
jgi:hypothetical protein